MTEKLFTTPTTNIFDSNIVPWVLVFMMFVVGFGAACWIILPS